MKTLKLFPCPDCRKRFDKLHKLNMHISRTDHNEGKFITKTQYLVGMGLQKSLVVCVNE